MSLVNALLNGGTVGAADVDVTRYGHSSAPRIAIESAAELHEIFMESFYNVEQAELAAATEGVALEGSQYEAVAENAIKNAATKIKEFLQKLWAKVKAFFHNIKRYLDAIFMSGADFVKKYRKEIDKIDKLEDYVVKMYKYDDAEIENVGSVLVEAMTNQIFKAMDVDPENAVDQALKSVEKAGGFYNEKTAKTAQEEADPEKVKKHAVKHISGGKCTEPDDFAKWCFGAFRNGAEGPDDKEEIEIKSVDHYTDKLAMSGKLGEYVNKAQKDADKAYSKAIKVISDCEKALDKVKDNKAATYLSKEMRAYSSIISTCQSVENTYFSAWKSVIKERDGVYKAVIMGAFSNAKKTAKKDK